MNLLITILIRIDIHIMSFFTLLYLSKTITPLIKYSKLPITYLKKATNTVLFLIIVDALYVILTIIKIPQLAFFTKIVFSTSLIFNYVMIKNVAICLCNYISKDKLTKTEKTILSALIVNNILITFGNLFAPISFTISKTCELIKYPYFIFNTLIGQLLALYSVVYLIRYRKNTSTRVKIALLFIILLPLLISILELVLNIDSLLYPTFAMSFSLIYLVFKNTYSTIDPKTKIKNYQTMLTNVENMKEKNYTLALLDINNLEYINNNYSYTEGNNLLEFVAQTISKNIPENVEVYFAGQDEFVITFVDMDKLSIDKVLDNIRENIKTSDFSKKKNYDISFTVVTTENDKEKKVLDMIKYLYYETFNEKMKKQKASN